MIVDLKGGTALITGAASGIGAAGRRLAAAGVRVTALDLDAPGRRPGG
jgi:NAD(P)-dependent dehydrogenase (short-subunit alcohol dehydrogenase family)